MANSDLYNLEFLSLVAKITQEIDNYTGLNDKTLAEFVIDLHDQSNQSLPAFKAKLLALDTNFPDSFIENVDRLILSMHPKHKAKHSSSKPAKKSLKTDAPEAPSEQEIRKRMFPGLALQDTVVPPAVSDDVFLQELGDLVSGRKPQDDDLRPSKRRRQDDPPPPRNRSPSPHRGRYNDRRDDRWGGRGRAPADDKPILFKIYHGRVSGLKDFGAFVTLEGVAGRVEGSSLFSRVSAL